MSSLLKKLLLTFIICPTLAYCLGANEQIKKSMAIPAVTDPLINEIVSIGAIKDHHFNLEAPQSCGPDGTISLSARAVSCQFHSSGEKKASVSICDNAKKYCKLESLVFTVQDQLSNTARLSEEKQPETLKNQKEIKKKLMKNFLEISPEKAKELLPSKKGMLVLVSTDWCPPCNSAKEFLLSKPGFDKVTKEMLLVYVDGDGAFMEQWAPYLKTFYYPSFVVLNKDFSVVDIKVGYFYEFQLKHWLSSALSHLNDPIKQLQKRIDLRIEADWLQSVKDVMVSESEKKQDIQRYLDYLDQRAEHEGIVSYMSKIDKNAFAQQIQRFQYYSVWYGKKSSSMSAEEKKKYMDDVALKILKGPLVLDSDGKDYLYKALLKDECSRPEEPSKAKVKKTGNKTKTKSAENKEKEYLRFTKLQCEKMFTKVLAQYDVMKNNIWAQLLPHEKLYESVNDIKRKATALKTQNKKEKVAVLYKECLQQLNLLYEYSPLKSRSRAIRFEQMGCLQEEDEKQSLEIMLSLVNDYPYESTFHSKLARIYLKKKDLPKAMSSVDKAIKYAYGNGWFSAIALRVKILMKMGKNKQALKLINSTLGEMTLTKNHKKNWILNSLRSLQKKVLEKLKL
ncbi:MAG: thioredoxin family protein [Bdellovibrionaceae bacterium]|jgi:hypothetical protein|nr:thioredoxin family protein [Pseudobdellovibrionaceae bacterium]